jgi:hypothetical protein
MPSKKQSQKSLTHHHPCIALPAAAAAAYHTYTHKQRYLFTESIHKVPPANTRSKKYVRQAEERKRLEIESESINSPVDRIQQSIHKPLRISMPSGIKREISHTLFPGCERCCCSSLHSSTNKFVCR